MADGFSSNEIFGGIGTGLMLLSAVPYFLALWKKKIKPHAFSWLLWFVINAVVLAAQVTKGAASGWWPTLMSMLITLSIGLYALKWGEREYAKSDWMFLALALFAIPLWVATKDPLWSVILVCVIDILAFFPTIRKSWKKPHEENALSFAVGAAGFFFSLLAIENFIFTNYAYPAVVMTNNLVFVGLLVWRRKALAC